jgi:hypothetical protein
MCERFTALLGGWSLYCWTDMLTDRTSGATRTVNSPEQGQLSSWLRSAACPLVRRYLYTETAYLDVDILESRVRIRCWLNKTMAWPKDALGHTSPCSEICVKWRHMRNKVWGRQRLCQSQEATIFTITAVRSSNLTSSSSPTQQTQAWIP